MSEFLHIQTKTLGVKADQVPRPIHVGDMKDGPSSSGNQSFDMEDDPNF